MDSLEQRDRITTSMPSTITIDECVVEKARESSKKETGWYFSFCPCPSFTFCAAAGVVAIAVVLLLLELQQYTQ
jgi:hypothetical protein